MDTPRKINAELVNAYKARTALDYLVGFEISLFCGKNYQTIRDLQVGFNP